MKKMQKDKDMLKEYDFSKGIQGKYAKRYLELLVPRSFHGNLYTEALGFTVCGWYHSCGGTITMKPLKIVVEKHPDTYLAYPLGIKGVVIGQGDTYEAAVADLKSAIQFHMETFGVDTLEVDPPILEAFVAEAGVPA